MNISPELLKSYFKNQCSEAEIRQVEKWLASSDDELSELNTDEANRMEANIWQRLNADIYGDEAAAPIFPLYKMLARYAAAACIIFTAFFGGRLSANTANEVVDKSPKDHLYIFGGNGVRGSLPGENFRLNFDGVLRLYNGDVNHKSIQVGDNSFVLESYQSYYLSGSSEMSNLLNIKYIPNDHHQETELIGDFSILRTDK